jgi:hypothetical protein
VMTTVATPPDADGWCSLSLHAGGTIGELHRAGADPDRLLVVEASEAYPRTFGLGEHHRHALHVDEIDILVRSTDAPFALPGGDAAPTDVDKASRVNLRGGHRAVPSPRIGCANVGAGARLTRVCDHGAQIRGRPLEAVAVP